MRALQRFLLYAALWSPVAIGFAAALAVTRSMPWPRALLVGILSTLPAALMGIGVIMLCARLPWRRTNMAAFVAIHAVASVAYSMLWSAAILTEMWMAAPPSEIELFLREGLVWQVVTGVIVYAVVAGISYARGAIVHAEESARAKERAETLLLRAELSALRARLDPHFLFNVLQTLGALVNEKPRHVHTAIEQLGGLLKRRIDAGSSATESASLEEELIDVRQYLTLEGLRFGDRLVHEEHIAADTMHLMIPRFTLQPLVENAIKHGLSPRVGGGRIAIMTRRSPSDWTLSVEDDGAGSDPSRFSVGDGVGISVLRERLRLRYGTRASLDVDTAPGAGCTVRVRLPYDPDEGA